MSKKGNRIEEIDYLRGFAILAVIAIHTSGYFTQIPGLNWLAITNIVIDVFSHFAVPLFIFISGFVLALKYKGSFSKRNFYKKRANSIIPQYLFFSACYILLKVILFSITGEKNPFNLIVIIACFLTANSSYHLWYIAIIVQLYILYPYIMAAYQKSYYKKKLPQFLFLAFASQEVWIIIRDIVRTYSNPIFETLLMRFFVSYIFYFVLGIYVCQNFWLVRRQISRIKKIPYTVLIFTVIYSLFWMFGILIYGSYSEIPNYYFIPLDLIDPVYFTSIFIILYLISTSFAESKSLFSGFILKLGDYSFGIYLIHVAYMLIFEKLISPQIGISPSNWIFYPALFISTLVLSYYSVLLISRLPYSKKIIGR